MLIAPPEDLIKQTEVPEIPDILLNIELASLLLTIDTALGSCNADKRDIRLWIDQAKARFAEEGM